MRSVWLGLAAATVAVAVAGQAQAQIGGPGPTEEAIRGESFEFTNGPDTLRGYYPAEALDRTISGRATVVCHLTVSGQLKTCVVQSEFPVGMGFGQAAVEKAEHGRLPPKEVDGKAVDGGQVPVTLAFKAPEASGRQLLTDGVWSQAPTFDDMAAAWPAKAAKLATGSAALRCRAGPEGDLRGCVVAGQVPEGSAFGAAALRLAPKFRLLLSPDYAARPAEFDVLVGFRFFNPTTPAGLERKVTRPDWTVRIDPRAIVALYPQPAAAAGVKEGVGVADCLITAGGRLTDCTVAREAPTDLGFGPAALLVIGVMQMDPWTPDGRPVAGARIRVPIRFTLAPQAAPAAP